MAIRINTRELLDILEFTPPGQNILLIGRHGIGKSEILTGHYSRRGLRVVALFLGQMSDPGDLIGLPTKNPETGQTEFMPPYWWPMDGKPITLFLDELNRARPEILQSVHDLALNRRLAGRGLPPGSVVVSAVNAGDEYQVTDLDPALASRFNIYEFVPEVDEWTAWARKNQVDPRIVGFIEHSGAFLDSPGQAQAAGEDPIEKAPDRRAWVRVSQMIRQHRELSPVLTKAIAGVVGVAAALALAKFLTAKVKLSAEQLLLEFGPEVTAQLDALNVQELVYLNKQALYWIEESAGKLATAKAQKITANVERYLDHLKTSRRGELVADLINQIEKGEFSRASALLLGSPRIMKALESYIHGVKL